MFKNLTIRQISTMIATSIWTIQVLLCILFIRVFDITIDVAIVVILAFALVTLVLSYFILRFLFETFVFRKIKLIYKVISHSKDSFEGVRESDLSSATLEDVNIKVLEWAEKTEKEITALKSLESYRQKFVGDISHELKTPIFTIQGYLHTLLEGGLYDENINRKFIKRALSNLSRLQTIVDDLELIHELESEEEVLLLTKFDIRELTTEVFRDLEMQASEKEISLGFKSGAGHSFIVLADRDKIHQVLINLISNSIKYGKQGGETKVGFYDMEKKILVEVSDDGIGVREEDMKHLFDRFFRADKSRSRQVAGSGLGLSIVKHIMEAHKQKITVRSTYKVGSTFGFTLDKG